MPLVKDDSKEVNERWYEEVLDDTYAGLEITALQQGHMEIVNSQNQNKQYLYYMKQ
jgi:hypothetical protein